MIRMAGLRFQPSSLHICLICTIMICLFYMILYSSYFSKLESKSRVVKPQGLKIVGKSFTFEKNDFTILSGSLHYFRVHHQQWEDRILKMKAMGLNTIDIYIPWNIHEPRPGEFNFNASDVNIASFLDTVRRYEMYAIIRPGPYICSEWDLGGLPSWLLKDKNMNLRSLYRGFTKAVDRYFAKLLPILKRYQFSYDRGPIIAFQIENEYGTYGNDNNYMEYLRLKFKEHGLEELFFVCDNIDGLGKYGQLKGVLQTINFMSKPYDKIIKKLEEFQPNRPVFVTELWDGWFSHWGESAHKVIGEEIASVLKKLLKRGASFNLYMWHGGTNFGFMNGANANDDGSNYQSDITSYDYDAPLDETGAITPKYKLFKKIIQENSPQKAEEVDLQNTLTTYSAYGSIKMEHYVTLNELISKKKLKDFNMKNPCSMEELDYGDGSGQLYGYIVYHKKIPASGSILKINRARDYVIVIVDGKIIHKVMSHKDTIEVKLPSRENIAREKPDKVSKEAASQKSNMRDLYILVENAGRVNYGRDLNNQRKGIQGVITLDDVVLTDWTIYPLDFTNASLEVPTERLLYPWVNQLAEDNSIWHPSKDVHGMDTPTLFIGELYVHGNAPRETFISLPGWYKGVVFLNGYHLGRYWNIGPQKTLYVPREYLRRRENSVVVFDLQGRPTTFAIESVPEADLGMSSAKQFLI